MATHWAKPTDWPLWASPESASWPVARGTSRGFSQDNAQALLTRAYLEDRGCWAEGVRPGGFLDVDKSWWMYAELDQLAATLAMRDHSFEHALVGYIHR